MTDRYGSELPRPGAGCTDSGTAGCLDGTRQLRWSSRHWPSEAWRGPPAPCLVDDGFGLQTRLLELTMSGYWTALHAWSRKTSHLSPANMALVLRASTPQGFVQIRLPKKHRKLALLKQSAEDERFRHMG